MFSRFLDKAPFLHRVNNRMLKLFSTEQKAKLFALHLASMGYSKGIPCQDTLDNYARNRTCNIDGFAAIKLPDGSTIGDKVRGNNTPQANALKDDLANYLALTDNMNTKIAEFSGLVSKVEAGIKEDPPRFNMRVATEMLRKLKTESLEELKLQHQNEKQALIDAFERTDPDAAPAKNHFVANLMQTFNVTAPSLDSIKNQMLAELEKNQKEQRSNIEKKINEDVNKMLQAAADEFDRISTMGRLYLNAENKAMIDKMHRDRYQGQDSEVDVEIKGREATLAGLKMQDLGIFESITGESLNVSFDDAGKMTTRLQIPGTGFFSRLNPFNWMANTEYDITSMAEAIKACGYDCITMNVSGNNQKENMENARKAYEACIRVGYPPEKIKIKVNGEIKSEIYKKQEDGTYVIKKEDKLFSGDRDPQGKYIVYPAPSRLAHAKQQAQIIKEERERAIKLTSLQDMSVEKLRSELSKLRLNAAGKLEEIPVPPIPGAA